eukprot:gb/GECH01014249.1/.p1 GENE.gb/GECH01014249.1/~~gb/GECH01014249.1/.p1  ORF type:complete len:138 (+),score=28.83 gb/GECH01014249.1/:1-414(+)
MSELGAYTAQAGKRFVEHFYYTSLDVNRSDLQKLYHQNADLIWNGTAYHGQQQILQFFSTLPPTSHAIKTINVQPLLSEPTNSILVSVQGTVIYGGKDTELKQYKRMFHQLFVLVSIGNGVYAIANDKFRWTSAANL